MHRVSKFKKYYLYSMLCSIVLAAMVGVTAIIFNNWTEISGRLVGTFALVFVHCAISLGAVRNNKSSANQLKYFSEILFWLLLASIFTSILAVWQLLETDMVAQLYLTYFVIGFSVLQGNLLYLLLNKNRTLTKLIWANLFCIAIVSALIFPVIFYASENVIGDIYYRILASLGIIDITLTFISVILYKLHLHKHPKEKNVLDVTGGFAGILRLIVGIFLLYFLFQVVVWILFMSFSAID